MKKSKFVARWDFGTVAVDVVGEIGRFVSHYWFHGVILHTGFVVGKVRKHWVLFFPSMSPNVFFVPDLYTHQEYPARFEDFSQVLRFIDLLDKKGGNAQ